MLKRIAAIVAGFVTLASGAATAATILDGSFENPVQTSGGRAYTYGPTAVGATFLGGAGVQANGSDWGFAAAPDGNQTAFLQNQALFGSSAIDLTVSQLTPGGLYTISFYESERPGYQTLPFSVTFGGTTILTSTPLSSIWRKVTTSSFRAPSSGGGTVSFIASPYNRGDYDAGLDDVTISAAPEPASWALMLVGFDSVGAAARARRGRAAMSPQTSIGAPT